jgi:hypothetical protein
MGQGANQENLQLEVSLRKGQGMTDSAVIKKTGPDLKKKIICSQFCVLNSLRKEK